MKLIDVDLLRKEIEFAKTVYAHPNRVVHGVADAFRQDGRAAMCDDILKKIDSLQQEQQEEPDKSLEEEVKRYYSDNFAYISSDQPTLSILTNIARHFAEWQKSQILKDAVEGRIGAVGLHNSIFIKEPEWTESLDRLNQGDKVKIIIVKED